MYLYLYNTPVSLEFWEKCNKNVIVVEVISEFWRIITYRMYP